MLEEATRRVIEELLMREQARIDDISRSARVDKGVLSIILRMLPGVSMAGDTVSVEDRLLLVIEGVKRGLPVKRLSKYISWRDFERLSAELLSKHGYTVYRNLLLTRPVRLEIDVLGIDIGPGRGIAIDCKHWIHGLSPSMLYDIGRRHIERVRRLLRYIDWAKARYPLVKMVKSVVPVIVTLTTPRIRCVDKRVVIVNINELNNFLQDLHLVLEELGVKPIHISEEQHTRLNNM